jgi:MoaA/NifB/PqqE/SkfB family radical SAM enzyme
MSLLAKAKTGAVRVFASQMLPSLLARTSDESLIRLTSIFEKVARTPFHKNQLRQLRELFRRGHPALELGRRVLSLHPNCRKHIISGLGINATWLGDQKRKEFWKREGIFPPYLIVISPLMRCNLRCLGCYAGNYPRSDDPLDFSTLDRIVTEAKEMGTYFITISGGEPFLRPDLLDLYEKRDDCVFLIYTNGTKIDDKVIERLVKCGNTAPAISVEGWEEQTDTRRGKGVYRQVMETMDRMREAGLFFGFSATAARHNAEVYLQSEFYDFMIEKGCLFGWFFIFVPVGQDSTTDLMITPEQRSRLRAKTMQIRRTKPLFVADFWNDGALTDGCMSGGTLYFHINYRGDLEPCVFVHFAEENILHIYQRGGHLWDVLKTPLFCKMREVNRRDPNRLRPCCIIDHNEWLEEALRQSRARPTHDGAEDIIRRLAPGLREWSEQYRKYADYAWYESGEYEWAKKNTRTEREMPSLEEAHMGRSRSDKLH